MILGEYPGCCTMKVLHHFDQVPDKIRNARIDATRRPTAWGAKALAIALNGQDLAAGAHIGFTGADNQTGPFSPFAFAEYLTDAGETVLRTNSIRHARHGNSITSFLWTPSEEWKALYQRCVTKLRDGTYGRPRRGGAANRAAAPRAAAPAPRAGAAARR